MFTLSGFISNAAFTNNAIPTQNGETPGAVAVIGELSTLSLTYAQQKGYYTLSTGVTPLTLTVFASETNSTPQLLTTDISDHVLTVAQALFTYAHTTGQIDATDTLNHMLTAFSGVATNFQCGAIVTDGTNYMPEWLSWENLSLSEIQSGGNNIQVWFDDTSFQNEYSGNQIVIIPPFTPLDNFFNPSSQVATSLAQYTAAQNTARIQSAKNGCPETILTCETFNYIDPLNSANTLPTNWYLLIYGAAGNNVDTIANALITYVLDNSTHNQSQWEAIMPDLFERTEFTMIPLWDNYSISPGSITAGIYSPVSNMANTVALVNQALTGVNGYTETQINTYANVMDNPYKSMTIATVGSTNNRNAQYEITDVFPDIINVSSTSADFNRMSQLTQNWLIMIATMLVIAETMTPDTAIPFSMSSVTRNGVLYLVQNYNNIDYLIAAKSSFPLA